MSFRLKVPPPSPEHSQLVYCMTCGTAMVVAVQNRRGSHGCIECGGQMTVWEPRPDRFGGLTGSLADALTQSEEEK